jgi:hypothetical protein
MVVAPPVMFVDRSELQNSAYGETAAEPFLCSYPSVLNSLARSCAGSNALNINRPRSLHPGLDLAFRAHQGSLRSQAIATGLQRFHGDNGRNKVFSMDKYLVTGALDSSAHI